jgi:hypothetical protein
MNYDCTAKGASRTLICVNCCKLHVNLQQTGVQLTGHNHRAEHIAVAVVQLLQ